MIVTLDKRDVELSDEQLSIFEQMTKLQRGVALATLHGANSADAHRQAGGKCNNEERRNALGDQILLNPVLQQFLDSFKVCPSSDIADAVLSRDQMLIDLTLVANADVSDFMDFTNGDRELMDLESGSIVEDQSIVSVKSMVDINPQQRRLIKSVKQGKYGIELTLHDAMAARKQITDMCGYNAPVKQEISITKQLGDFYDD